MLKALGYGHIMSHHLQAKQAINPKLNMVADTCDPHTWGAENHESRACLSYAARTCQK